jgi:hypothetical protein
MLVIEDVAETNESVNLCGAPVKKKLELYSNAAATAGRLLLYISMLLII